jgi:hypothetical protein
VSLHAAMRISNIESGTALESYAILTVLKWVYDAESLAIYFCMVILVHALLAHSPQRWCFKTTWPQV